MVRLNCYFCIYLQTYKQQTNKYYILFAGSNEGLNERIGTVRKLELESSDFSSLSVEELTFGNGCIPSTPSQKDIEIEG